MNHSKLPIGGVKPRQKLLTWFRHHGRDLPWRRHPEPWAIVLSEFLLQQTPVATVLPRFAEWMRRFPSPAHLAQAPENEILSLWQGLGYYRRAINLHRAARAIVQEHGGRVPDDPAILRQLPGFGCYTASAVAAFAFDRPVPVLDANILRVGARLGNVGLPIESAKARFEIEKIVGALLPARRGGRLVISALMDLGALVCRPRAPQCPACPLREYCQAEKPESLPRKKPRPEFLRMEEHRAWISGPQGVALVPSPGPWWKGLWLLPPATPVGPPLLTRQFRVTHHCVTLRVFRGESPPVEARWFPSQDLPPMPTPHRLALKSLLLARSLKQTGGGRRS